MRFFFLILQAAAVVLITTAAPLPPRTVLADTVIATKRVLLDTSAPYTNVITNEGPPRKRPKNSPDSRTQPLDGGHSTVVNKPTDKGASTSSFADSPSLQNAIHSFDMAVQVRMADTLPGRRLADGTTTTPASAMLAALRKAAGDPPDSTTPVNLPKLSLTYGNFQAVVPKSWFEVEYTTRLQNAVTLLEGATAAKTQYATHRISGELELSHLMTHGLAVPATEVLAAVGQPHAYWSGVGLGGSPIPDLQFHAISDPDSDPTPLAVVEIKTTSSMSNAVADDIFNNFDKFTMTMIEEGLKTPKTPKNPTDSKNPKNSKNSKNSKVPKSLAAAEGLDDTTTAATEAAGRDSATTTRTPVPSIMHPFDIKKEIATVRNQRKKSARILEQLLSQMWDTGAMVGAITNLEVWLVVERVGDTHFKITKIPGMVNGRSNGLNVMLAMSAQALSME